MLIDKKYTWLVTGCAGFIGSNILEYLLLNNQQVIGLDNFATGFQRNLDEVELAVGEEAWANFKFIQGDLRNFHKCLEATENVDIVLQQAALGSVPRSIDDPISTHDTNVTGFINLLKASLDNKVKRFVFASSSSVYGDHPGLPKYEETIGRQLSPYAVSKYTNELYASVFAKTYGMEVVGLRYFNVFGQRQDPSGAYAAVIPLWFKAVLNNVPPILNGDGTTSRDFCYVNNVVQANILAGITQNKSAINRVYNVACNEQTTLNQLFSYIKNLVDAKSELSPAYCDFRPGDIAHSLADISLAMELLGYSPEYKVTEGLKLAADWYKNYFGNIKLAGS